MRHLTAALAIRPRSASTRLDPGLRAMLEGHEHSTRPSPTAARGRPASSSDDATAHADPGQYPGRWRWDFDAAEAECREAVRLKPDDATAHSDLGSVLVDQERWQRREGKYDEGIVELREAIRLAPEYAYFYVKTADSLQRNGDYAGARDIMRKAREGGLKVAADPWHSEQWLAKIEPMAALAERLPAIFKGEDRPKDVAERLDLVQICYDKRLFVASVRLWSEFLEADPKLGDDRGAQHRYNAACSAALAAAGQDKGDGPPDDAARSKLRRQALGWLEAELAAWSRIVESGTPQDRAKVAATLRHWRKDADLAAIRDADALAKLPEAERKDWQAFWVGCEALMRKGDGPQPR